MGCAAAFQRLGLPNLSVSKARSIGHAILVRLVFHVGVRRQLKDLLYRVSDLLNVSRDRQPIGSRCRECLRCISPTRRPHKLRHLGRPEIVDRSKPAQFLPNIDCRQSDEEYSNVDEIRTTSTHKCKSRQNPLTWRAPLGDEQSIYHHLWNPPMWV